MDSLRYAYYYGLVSLLRVADGLRIRDMVRLSLEAFPPSQKLEVPSSKDGNRTIKIHVYVPPSAAGKAAERRPVHINWHGSGFGEFLRTGLALFS